MAAVPLSDEARLAALNLRDRVVGLWSAPSVRLGVTGLSRAGKTVFLTALVHNLIHGGRLPLFSALAQKRLERAYLQPQPDDAVPRFDYEAHVADLVDRRIWPDSTRRISELRLTVEYRSATLLGRNIGRGRIHLDFVDYPGEWLLDLGLLGKDFRSFSAEALALASSPARADLAAPWLAATKAADPAAPADEALARDLAASFTDYLRRARADRRSLAALPPGRFLMPGDLEGSPALTFAPLPAPQAADGRGGSLWAMMERRYDAYRDIVVRPFFRDHFARLDRQIVLVDALPALNAGSDALADLETALADILAAFRPGRASWLAAILTRRIDRILFAATKADQLPSSSHDRLEAVLRRLVRGALSRAEFAGADVDVVALAAVRATREAHVRQDGELLPAIIGMPMAGETLDGEVFDGKTEIALFPGDLPADPETLFQGGPARAAHSAIVGAPSGAATEAASPVDLRFLKFRPPKLERSESGALLSLPHIRLDRALEFLVGDTLA